jgi:SAM-dependent methyltransferase
MDSENHLSWCCDGHTSSDLYRKRFKGRIGSLFIERQNTLLLSFLGDIGGKRVLDVGAGHGQLAASLISAGAEVTAYGSSEDALKRLAALPVRSEVGPLFPLPFKDGEFDIAVSFRTFAHVPDWRIFLKELCRVSRETVAFDFVTNDLVNFFKPLAYRLKMRREPGTRDYTLQRRVDVKRRALELGFRWKRGEGQFLLPLVMHRIIGKPLLMPIERLARMARITKLYGGPVVAVLQREA